MAMTEDKLLFQSGDDWTPEILEAAWEQIEIIAEEEMRIKYFKPQIEIITARQMLDAYTSVGMPTYYKHWSFGKEFVSSEKQYIAGKMGLAYEIVINSDPCIAYLMEENAALMQTLVMAHASVGHSAVFANNYLFTQNTDASSIVDYLNFAKTYIKMCEEKYGFDEVELVIDACHALSNYGVDKYKRPPKLSAAKEQERAMERFDRELAEYDPIWEKVGRRQRDKMSPAKKKDEIKLVESQENILYFIEKNAPHLPGWKREIIRIVRKISHYFSPQRATKVVNEGFASFTHYYIVNRLYDKGYLSGGSMIEFFASHNNVLNQQPLAPLNPYKLGFSIFMDIKRMCENPTPEDREYFPNVAGKDWVEEVKYAMTNFKDETFILQYLSPKVARDMQLFCINSESKNAEHYGVTEISDRPSFESLRTKLAANYAIENMIPDIQISGVDYKRTRKLQLEHHVKNGKPINIEDAKKVIQYVSALWEYSVHLNTFEYTEAGTSAPVNITAMGKYSLKQYEEK
jgi:stage V sporulation protein R